MSLFPWRSPKSPQKKDKDLFGMGQFFQDVEQEFKALTNYSTGLSISSDEKFIYVQADVPGMTAQEVNVEVDNDAVLWIKGQRWAEEQKRHYYRKAQSNFSYCVPLGNDVDLSIEPKAVCKNGVMHITFTKKQDRQTESKKIAVKEE